jgi:hypothetical protein
MPIKETKGHKTADERKADTDKFDGLTDGLTAGTATLTSAEQIWMSSYLAAQNAATQQALSVIAQQAATQAAVLKMSNDLNDATVSFMKNIGSSVKSAAQ